MDFGSGGGQEALVYLPVAARNAGRAGRGEGNGATQAMDVVDVLDRVSAREHR